MTEYKSRPRFYESGYIPPIKLSYEESMQSVIERIAQGVDEMVINSCLKVGINVDKKRLIQVLNGDRSQYEKGEWDMFLLITSAWNGKQYYFLQGDGTVFERIREVSDERRSIRRVFEPDWGVLMIPEPEREAILRLTMCARRNCAICKYGPKKPKVKLSESCAKRITENMNLLAKACDREE